MISTSLSSPRKEVGSSENVILHVPRDGVFIAQNSKQGHTKGAARLAVRPCGKLDDQ